MARLRRPLIALAIAYLPTIASSWTTGAAGARDAGPP